MMYTRQNASSWRRRPRRGWLTSGTKWFSCKCSLKILPLLTSKLRAHLVSSMLQAQHLSWSKKKVSYWGFLRVYRLRFSSTVDCVDARSRFQINTAEWFNGVFLCIKLTHDFKKKIGHELMGNFGIKFSLFYKGKMAKISPKINKIEIWPKSRPKVINS